MVLGQALQNTLTSFPDFIGEKPGWGCTVSREGPPVLVDCLKCPECGYSVTAPSMTITADADCSPETKAALVEMGKAAVEMVAKPAAPTPPAGWELTTEPAAEGMIFAVKVYNSAGYTWDWNPVLGGGDWGYKTIRELKYPVARKVQG